jgi:NADPH-dependent 2,4-dienoyl-CoA reductase/sulfur reductase-like enzyme
MSASQHGNGAARQAIGRVVIVGASLCGLRAAEALRAEGHDGEIVVIGDEPHEPYDRPPLSKQVILGLAEPDRIALPQKPNLDVDWRLGVAATSLNPKTRTVRLADGSEVTYDKLLIATGTRARPWFNEEESKLEGVIPLRSIEHSVELKRLLTQQPKRVLVIGSGFTGSEVASACCDIGINVTVVERGQKPLHTALGGVIGDFMAERQREHGVDLRLGVSVEKLEGEGGRLKRAHLSDGTTLDVDIAVIALGGVRNVEWLADSELAVGDWGVACDAGCRVFDQFGMTLDDVFVAGDVARFPHPLFDFEFVTLEHWGNAVAQAATAAHNMLADPADRLPYLHLPNFWSNQFGLNIKSVGAPSFGDQAVITQGSLESKHFVMAFGHEGRVCAAVTVNEPKWLELYERLIAAGAPFPPVLEGISKPEQSELIDPDFPKSAPPDSSLYIVFTGYRPSDLKATLIHTKL